MIEMEHVMDYLRTILLGLIQGIAEFLPISSSGHLAILGSFLGESLENVELNVALHIGTLMSILVVYRNDLLPLLGKPRLMAAIVVATLPVVFTGLLLKDFLEQHLTALWIIGCSLCITGILMGLSRRVEHGERTLDDITLRDALIIGLFQAVAPVPGISRSGSTIFGGLVAGLSRDAAARFSFFIAIPAIGGAAVLYSKDLLEQGAGDTPLGPLLAGTAVAFVVGLASLSMLLRLVTRQKLHWFAWYCLTVGISVVVWQALASRIP